jgi:Ca-activated chloride channel family protein
MELLADKGNGNYAYIDSLMEARKVLVSEIGGTLFTVAKDVKLQLEFNPAYVAGYRLLGYENRLLRSEDFNDDAKDAGEVGSGHSVTALYEIVPAGVEVPGASVDPLKYQTAPKTVNSAELLTVKVRYKEPDGESSRLMSMAVVDSRRRMDQASEDLRFAAAVAEFAMLLRGSEHRGEATYEQVARLASTARSDDRDGYRSEFLQLVDAARAMTR